MLTRRLPEQLIEQILTVGSRRRLFSFFVDASGAARLDGAGLLLQKKSLVRRPCNPSSMQPWKYHPDQ